MGNLNKNTKSPLKENFTPGTGAQIATPKAFKTRYKLKRKPIKEEEEVNSAKKFQQGRIASFDSIEQELNSIYKILSNAKNETSEFYQSKPGSYEVVYPTDLILDYIRDIKELLSNQQ